MHWGPELDSRTDLAELRRLLEHLHREAPACERQRRGQSADATAGHQNRKIRSHHVHRCPAFVRRR
jgi:hypothetical protein